ncbi:MAG TPA: 2-oxoacid:acceptor oxidoreductase family protein [Candidatus Limnocylindrales bacterium]|jgi:Pyruvate:ferredoxin oxidoreductase and related 2-oxoacid:ferredoxin oxidoreductases, alpha subunit|nr:2-oxoacid:acceptor oxidoreductase family protein [Candidatus Limnocylindrales bacterium]
MLADSQIPLRRLLIVSQHRAATEALCDHLSRHGFIVAQASCESAAREAATARPDVVLLDADVAGGWRPMAAALRDLIPAERIAVLASYWHTDEQREAVASGIGGTLLKHLDGSALARQLRALSEPTIVTNTPTPEFPGIPAIIDGSEAIAYVETRISDGACAYPITPSTTMAAVYQVAVANGTPNLWGTHLKFIEPESEHSSASAAEGFALAGGRVTNFTAGQGLILMKEVLYVIAGKRLPAVFHVGARALTSQSLNIHAGHDDMMGVADAGWGMFFARNCQEAADLTAIARRVAEDGETPWFVAQDGFLTTHTIENVQLPEDDLLRRFVGDPRETVRDLFDPKDALMSGVVQNQDSYMKGRIAQRVWYDRLVEITERAMAEWTALTGRHYGLIDTYKTEDADYVMVSMGTMADTALAVVDALRADGRKVGCVTVTSFRPFPAKQLAAALRNAKVVAVIERTDEPAAADNPLTRELKSALADAAMDGAPLPRVVSASAGLGSRDIQPGDLAAVFDWIADEKAVKARRRAVLGIRHPLALANNGLNIRPKGAYSLRGHSVGGFGSVTTNKLVATTVGELFNLHVQAYPRYGSEKKGLPTTYFLTIAEEPIRLHNELTEVDFVPLFDTNSFKQGDPLAGLVDGGTVFVPTPLTDPDEIWAALPPTTRAEILARKIRLLALDTASLAMKYAPRPDLEIRMQGVALVGVFLRVSPFAERAGLDRPALMEAVRGNLTRFFGKRGSSVVDANLAVIQGAYDGVIDVTASMTSKAAVPAAEATR